MTVHEANMTGDFFERYFKVEKKAAADPLDDFLPEHLINHHLLDVSSGEYTRAIYAHRLALGEGNHELREVLAELQRQATESEALPKEGQVLGSPDSGGIIK